MIAIALARRRALALEVLGVDVEVGERPPLFSTSRLRPAISMICRAVRPLNRNTGRLPTVDRRRSAGSPRWRSTGAGSPPCTACTLHARERLPVDPDRARVERRVGAHRLEAHDVAVVAVDALGAGQPVAVAFVEAQLQRQRQHLLRLQQRKRRTVGAPLRAVHRERQLLPLDVAAGDEVAVLGDARRSPRHAVVDRSAGSAAPCARARCSSGRSRPARAAAADAAR